MKTSPLNKKIGLALGSGAWRGLAHIGVIKSLSQNNFPIDFIAGSSVGSIIGGLYAAIGDINEVEKIAISLSFRSIIKSIFQKPSGKISIFNKRFDHFFRNIIGNIKIEDLNIPYCAVASDLITGKSININQGSLVTAMEASSAVPLFFKPVKIDNNYFFDGGMTTPIPTDIIRQMGADIVIGVNLYGGIFPINLDHQPKLSRIKATKISRFLWLNQLAQINLKSADIPLDLKIPDDDYGFFVKFLNNQKVIDYGQKSTDAVINQINQQLKSR
jgi:predicted acylesterase/phospholipase RssA